MAALPLPSISALANFGQPQLHLGGLPPFTSPMAMNALQLLGQKHDQQFASVAASLSGLPLPASILTWGKPKECFPTLPSIVQTCVAAEATSSTNSDLSKILHSEHKSSENRVDRVADVRSHDDMDHASSSILFANPVSPRPSEEYSKSNSIESILSPHLGHSHSMRSDTPSGSRSTTSPLPSKHCDTSLTYSSAASRSLDFPQSSSAASSPPSSVHRFAAAPMTKAEPSQNRAPARGVDRCRNRATHSRGDFPQQINQSRYWAEAEHQRFLQAVRSFGAHNHKAIASFVGTRSSAQVRSHSQKFFKKLETFRGQGLPSMTRKRKTLKDISMHQ
eukprot:CAMPEP_0181305438 /NCGR_PEP_ID=MMETSP1101-20121128/9729_1 /TAXON_ID=46948 /ORGANISM="Rhodomonas abbreviata, Strain Caron Lab Isolate" /LENGTH=333 /DNA_ID=CAMNT_0023411353 /DNA_START=213 /DNA_END=1214 /DNA_ORIENTATION=-